MNKSLYLQTHRPQLFVYKLNKSAARAKTNPIVIAREARYQDKLNFLSSIKLEIMPKTAKLWEDSDESEEIGSFNPFKGANRRKTDGSGSNAKSFAAHGYSVHTGQDNENNSLRFAQDSVKREVEVTVE